MNTRCLVQIILAASLAACGPVAGGAFVPIPSTAPVATRGAITATPLAVLVATGAVGTAVPVVVSTLPANITQSPTNPPPTLTPIPNLPVGLSPTELKYQ